MPDPGRITLPRTDLSVSPLCLGGNKLGGDLDQAASFALLDSFVAGDGNFIDTAHVYADWIPGNERSSSERTIGRWLRDRRPEGIVVATKGGHPAMHDPAIKRLDAASLRSDVEGSLACLGLGTLDLFYLHRDDPTRPVADILEALEALRIDGLIRYYAASNWSTARLAEAEATAGRNGWPGFVAHQAEWSLAIRNPGSAADDLCAMDREMLEFHRRTGMAAIPYSSQAKGYFDKAGSAIDAATALAYDNRHNRRLAEVLKHIASRHGATPTQVMLAALTQAFFMVVPVIGCRTPEQVAVSMASLALHLTEVDRQHISDLSNYLLI